MGTSDELKTIEGNLEDAIVNYLSEQKPVGVFFFGIIDAGNGMLHEPTVFLSANFRLDWLADKLEELARFYRREAAKQEYSQ